MQNSLEIIRPFCKLVKEQGISNLRLVGGIAAVALGHPDTIIDMRDKKVIAPDDLYLSNIRDDGTLRDLDIRLYSSQQSDFDKVQETFNKTIGNQLELSIFRLGTERELYNIKHKPFGLQAITSHVSNIFQTKEGLVKALPPFCAKVDNESLEEWSLIYKDIKAPIQNPALSLICYTDRDIVGMRKRDVIKVKKMARNVFQKMPELRDWAVYGPGNSQFELGLLLRSLTPYRQHDDIFNAKKPTLPIKNIIDHEYFMYSEATQAKKYAVIGQAVIKAYVASKIEGPRIGKSIKKIIRPILKGQDTTDR